MLYVSDVLEDVKRVLGTTSDAIGYSRLNDIQEILATEADWDPTRGYVDVWVGCDRTITLPPQVDTILAVNLNGHPTEAHDFWFKFHLNGPGERFGCAPLGDGGAAGQWGWEDVDWSWSDQLQVPIIADPRPAGCVVVSQLETAADAGTPLRVYGYDVQGDWIRSIENGLPVDGFLVPTIYGVPTPNLNAPLIRTVTRVSKMKTLGYITMWGVNADGSQFQTGNYGPKETEPLYRRIRVSQSAGWARIAFKKRSALLSSLDDPIFLHSRYAVILMAKALKKFDDDRVQEGEAYQAKAVSLLIKKQLSVSVPGGPSIQVADRNLIMPKNDRME